MTALPLDGVRVVSVGHTLPGIYCVAILRDLGADVVLVERVTGAAGSDRYAGLAGRFPTDSLRAGLSRLELNLKSERGRELFLRLASRADVVLEGFRPGAAARLGIDFDAVKSRNPAIVYAAISGFGQEGPARDRAGHDIGYLASTGVLDLSGRPGEPPAFAGITFADGLAGVTAALNVVAALHGRVRSREGSFLDLAIVDGPAFLMSSEFEHYFRSGETRSRGDTHLAGRYPWYGVFETADGRFLSVGAVEPAFHAELCRVIGHPELAARQITDGEELERQRALFRTAFRSRTLAEWRQFLAGVDACIEPVLTAGEAAGAAHLERVRRTEAGFATPLVRTPVRLGERPFPSPRPARALLESLGLTAAEITELVAAGVVGRS